MIGYDSAFIGGTLALNSFKSEFNWSQYSDHEANVISENIVSLYQAGAFFGMTKLPPNSDHRQANYAQELSLLMQQVTISYGRRASKSLLNFHPRSWSHAWCERKPRTWTDLWRTCFGWYWSWWRIQFDPYLHLRIVSPCNSWATCRSLRNGMADWWCCWILDKRIQRIFPKSNVHS
jgi:hypothetical protein